MKLGFSRDLGTVKVAIDENNEEEDLMNATRIEKMVNSEEWQILMMSFLKCKEKYDEAIMKVKPTEVSFKENAIYAARLNGFWEAVGLAGKIVEVSKEYRKRRLAEMEEEQKHVMNGDGVVPGYNFAE